MASRPPAFILANSTSCRVVDRFSDLEGEAEDDNGFVRFWPLLTHYLQRPVSSTTQLLDLLETITAVTGGTNGDGHESLKRFLGDGIIDTEKFFNGTWSNLLQIALDLDYYFPEGKLDLLKPGEPLRLSSGQVACLVVHQFLCSAVQQRYDDGYQDFSVWYASEQRHPAAIEMYLTALFTYLSGLPEAQWLKEEHKSSAENQTNSITYELHQKLRQSPLEGVPLGPVHLKQVKDHTTNSHLPEVQGPKGAVVVSANSVIGFGQSATQEEIFVGIAPQACPVVLVAPHLDDETVITVAGARAMLDVKGQRRDVSWNIRPIPLPKDGYDAWLRSWRGGRLTFMDALEMDMVEDDEDLLDLMPLNINREIHKAITGFTAHAERDSMWSGLWGCGAFCGDAGVKLLILWIAASVAKVRLNLILGSDQEEIGRQFEKTVKACRGVSAKSLRRMLDAVPKDLREVEILEWIEGNASEYAEGTE